MNKAPLLLLILLLPLQISAQTPRATAVAFVNVSVIPMDKERLLRNQTVIVRDGVISEMVDTKRIKIPRDAQRIDGAGKFLIPGLSDMHVHLFSDDEFPDTLAGDE